MCKKTLLVMMIGILAFLSGVDSAPNTGAEHIVLEGGNTGDVPFPHRRHQERIDDCSICHELFDQEAGSIERLIANDMLKVKQVMNTQCLKCHREMKKAGNASGPLTCATCHNQPKQD